MCERVEGVEKASVNSRHCTVQHTPPTPLYRRVRGETEIGYLGGERINQGRGKGMGTLRAVFFLLSPPPFAYSVLCVHLERK